MDAARHHVLTNASSSIAIDGEDGILVHAAAVVTNMPIDSDAERAIESGGDRMQAVRIFDQEITARGSMQQLIDVANGHGRQIERGVVLARWTPDNCCRAVARHVRRLDSKHKLLKAR